MSRTSDQRDRQSITKLWRKLLKYSKQQEMFPIHWKEVRFCNIHCFNCLWCVFSGKIASEINIKHHVYMNWVGYSDFYFNCHSTNTCHAFHFHVKDLYRICNLLKMKSVVMVENALVSITDYRNTMLYEFCKSHKAEICKF